VGTLSSYVLVHAIIPSSMANATCFDGITMGWLISPYNR